MRLQWTAIRQNLQTSLWTYPALAVAVALFGVQALTAVDRRIGQGSKRWYLFGGDVENARELLSTIASSMLSFTALVFSITILALQLASSQFSPRVIRTFLEDPQTRLTLATFVGSFVFSMALIPELRAGGDSGERFVPALSVFVAFVLVLISVGVFIQYVHHMAHSVRAVQVIKRVGDETRRSIDAMYPEEALDDASTLKAPDDPPDQIIIHDRPAGVVTHVDVEGLLAVAREHDVTIGMVPFVGDFVARGAPLFRVWGSSTIETTEVRQFVVIAEERTQHQDPAFGLRQLADIAERALSPGINDPTTAVQALDQAHDVLRTLARRHFPTPLRADADGKVRLILPAPDWDALVRLALEEIRQYGEGSIQVMRRMRAILEDLLSVAPEGRRRILREQLDLLEAATRRGFKTEAERDTARAADVQGQGPTKRRDIAEGRSPRS